MRYGIAPEKLLRAMLIQVLYSVRSERQLMDLGFAAAGALQRQFVAGSGG